MPMLLLCVLPCAAERTYEFSAANTTVFLPYSTIFYALYIVADFPAWGQQPATYYLASALNKEAKSGKYHSAFIVGDIAYAEGVSAHWDVSGAVPLRFRLNAVVLNWNAGVHAIEPGQNLVWKIF